MNSNLLGGYLVVGLIWGTTNALMEKGTKEDEKKRSEQKSALAETGSMFSNLGFLIPFLVN